MVIKSDPPEHCPDCGYNMTAFGRSHNCRPRIKITPPLPDEIPGVVIANVGLKDLPAEPPTPRMSGAERQKRWRDTHADLNRERARDGMKASRKRRG